MKEIETYKWLKELTIKANLEKPNCVTCKHIDQGIALGEGACPRFPDGATLEFEKMFEGELPDCKYHEPRETTPPLYKILQEIKRDEL